VITAPRLRQRGLGKALMSRAMEQTKQLFPGQAICIAAQAHLQAFYRRFGFVATGDPYDEDGILHVDMTAP
jgi:ElaA protein